jgi:hypothetical protein
VPFSSKRDIGDAGPLLIPNARIARRFGAILFRTAASICERQVFRYAHSPMKIALLLSLVLFCVSCHRPPETSTPTAEQSLTPASNATSSATDARISASPNPIKGGPEEGTTTITWDTKSNEIGEVYVIQNGGPEKLFTKGSSGSKTVSWIREGGKYEFRLYEKASHKLLGRVQVTHVR